LVRRLDLGDFDLRFDRYRLIQPKADQLMAGSLSKYSQLAPVKLLQAASTQEQTQFVLEKPRQAIRQSQDSYVHQWDPRLSTAGNRVARRLGLLLDAVSKMNHWLRLSGRSELQACDRSILVDSFLKLAHETSLLSEATGDFIQELQLL